MRITDKYVFFWGGIYSQWYKAKMTIDNVAYNCCEQYMMHQKALMFKDKEIADRILKVSDPKHQKELGRQVRGFRADVWDKMKLDIVIKGNYAKFSQNRDLRRQMLSVDNRQFVEASPKDTIWGIGMHENDPGVENPANWKGENLLGIALTKTRDLLKNG